MESLSLIDANKPEKVKKVLNEVVTYINQAEEIPNITKESLGLGNVDNTSDLNKPVSIAQQEAIDEAVENHNLDTSAHLDVRTIVNSLASEVSTISSELEDTISDLDSHKQNVSNPHNVTKAQVGLGNADNTSDIDKPVSTAQQQAIDSAVSTHNENNSAHSDIRTQINNIVTGVTEVTNVLNAKNYNVTTGNIKTKFDELTNTINTLSQEIEAQSGLGGYLNAHNFGKANPTQQELTNYALSQISNITTETEIFNGTRVKNLFDGHLWVLTNTQDTDPIVFEWADNGYDTVSVATNTSLGVVQGGNEYVSILNGLITVLKAQNADTLGGQAPEYYATLSALNTLQSNIENAIESKVDKVEGKGLSTNDFTNEYKSQITENEQNISQNTTNISTLQTQTNQNTTNISTLQSSKLNANQGTANAGKLLMVGEDGEVSPQNIEGGTIVNVDGQPQSTLDFDSDPQGQIDGVLQKTNNFSISKSGGFGGGKESIIFDYKRGGAIGYMAWAGDGFSGGNQAQVSVVDGTNPIDTIQLGTGVNRIEKSLQVYSDNIYNAKTHKLGTALLNAIYPVGAVYISVNNTSPANLFGGTWEALDEGYALWTTTTANTGGNTITAGLPNIAGRFNVTTSYDNYNSDLGLLGAFAKLGDAGFKTSSYGGACAVAYESFNASAGECGTQKMTPDNAEGVTYANNVYGKSETVQPPAIRVYVWKRIS